MRELRVEDALLYLDQVKVEFGDRPHIYNEFLDIMKTFKTQQIDTPGVIRRVSTLFQGNRRLVLGFNTFLPEGYRIELPEHGGPAVAVYRGPNDVQHIQVLHPEPPPPGPGGAGAAPGVDAGRVGMPGGVAAAGGVDAAMLARGQQPHLHHAAPLQQPTAGFPPAAAGPGVGIHSNDTLAHERAALAARGMGLPSHAGQPSVQQPPQQHAQHVGGLPGGMASQGATASGVLQPAAGAPGQPGAQQGEAAQPMEFDHAINYVTTIKKRFADDPETYKKFLEILHTYQKEQRGIKEVLEEVSVLFADHPDLLREFTYFLPDAVQSEAKAQLDIIVKQAEERKRQRMASAAAAATAAARQTVPVQSQVQPPAPPVQAAPKTYTAAAPTPSIAFGATQPRSIEREKEIHRTSVYGKVTFGLPRPPRKGALSVQQSAQQNGRQAMLPPLPPQPTTAESAFFERAKRHLSRRELASDKPPGRSKHTPHAEFLKCLHLFGVGVLNKDELVQLLRGLFVQGHAPKSGANAGGASGNPGVAHDAHELLKELEEILVSRGPYASQQNAQKDRSKYGAKRTRDFDFKDCKNVTPSYRELPKDYPATLFMSHTGKIRVDEAVLNDEVVSICRINSADAKKRHNAYEEELFRIEDERFEVDMAIERNALAMRQVEPIAEEVTMLKQGEEKDGQPIGRLQYRLNPRTINSIQINAIGRIYGEHGDEVIEYLARNPLAVLPIVYQRLRQKDVEWRKQKSELIPRWKEGCEANYEGSMDVACDFERRDVERSFALEALRDECKQARKYCSERRDGPVRFGLSLPDSSAILYDPYAVVDVKPESPVHHGAVRLLVQHSNKKCVGRDDIREKVGRVLSEFLISFFDYPSYWVADEARESFRGKINNFVVRYATGQVVSTIFGEGTIQEVLETDAGTCYRVKLDFGTSTLQPQAIMHAVPAADEPRYARRDDEMLKDASATALTTAPVVDSKFKVLFLSDSVYLFMRLYTSLLTLLDEIEGFLRENPSPGDPARRYYNPMKSSDDKHQFETKLDFPAVMMELSLVVSKKLTPKDFETFCRKVSPAIVYKMAALPKLVEKCGDMLIKLSEEDLLPRLYDLCQYRGQNPVILRQSCLAISPEVSYRIQLNTSNGRMYFTYLPEGEELSTVPTGDADDDEDMDVKKADDIEDDDDDEDDMDLDHEEEDLRAVKRARR
mmetsp:Transcript_56377/g.136777  ORF Transcript_56377/g.136777 Transcript_56377/m.136777 type:complete len:1195 (-) Transcript_56377:123-3707(-)